MIQRGEIKLPSRPFSLVAFWIWSDLFSVHTGRDRCTLESPLALYPNNSSFRGLGEGRPGWGRGAEKFQRGYIKSLLEPICIEVSYQRALLPSCSTWIPADIWQSFTETPRHGVCLVCVFDGESFACSLLHHWDREKFPYLSVCVRKHHSWERSCCGGVETQVFGLVLKLNVPDRLGSEY